MMELKFDKNLLLLALAYTPTSGTSILDWSPFSGGDSLNTIIEKHNARCMQHYQDKLHWLSENIKMLGKGIDIVPHDMSTLSQLQEKVRDIDILLVDLDAFKEKSSKIEENINHLKARMLGKQKKYHLLQISKTSNASSQRTYFTPLSIVPSEPEIFSDQNTFESYLGIKFCGLYSTIANSAFEELKSHLPTGVDPNDTRAMLEYVDVPGIAANVRDIAILKNMSINETEKLTRRAVTQETYLTPIAEMFRTETESQIVLDPIREPVDKITIEQEPELQRVNLLKVSLARPWSELTTEQRKVSSNIGLRGESFAAVHLDQPTILRQVDSLNDVVKTFKFSAMLPR
jgi:hypothetical protein